MRRRGHREQRVDHLLPGKATDRQQASRSGSATLDWILVTATMLPILAFVIPNSKRMMVLVWEMFCVQVSWPFL
ncbi:MAG: hypothetical protein KF777_22535 [Planctomycetaceae bacterium]|nr:hypothetical protein [Planctomycetaceae bacterium]